MDHELATDRGGAGDAGRHRSRRARHGALSLHAALIVVAVWAAIGCGERTSPASSPEKDRTASETAAAPEETKPQLPPLTGEAPQQRIYVAVPQGDSAWARDVRRGVDLGAADAARVYQLVEGTFEIVGRPEEAAVVIAVADDAPRAAMVLDVRDAEDALPGAWKLSGGIPAGAVAWDGALTGFGAAQLNERYRTAYGSEMTPAAWYGWLAVKIAAEAAVTDRSLADLQFDGYKGTPLRFDTSRRLVHPAFRLEGGEWVVVGR